MIIGSVDKTAETQVGFGFFFFAFCGMISAEKKEQKTYGW